ncbi:hypothetical protein FVE85_8410 [Porphyridium purpureum]|uniref:Uncharacterized protein n=1 Tax=Porphyridium purpureum TaxID=35688 RepID=A0A5J4YKX0_PORPP|nr:hypothetical protein FVE85_8410 [Porphyridium purpureum]|eukprot:POR4883..scf244_11
MVLRSIAWDGLVTSKRLEIPASDASLRGCARRADARACAAQTYFIRREWQPLGPRTARQLEHLPNGSRGLWRSTNAPTLRHRHPTLSSNGCVLSDRRGYSVPRVPKPIGAVGFRPKSVRPRRAVRACVRAVVRIELDTRGRRQRRQAGREGQS